MMKKMFSPSDLSKIVRAPEAMDQKYPAKILNWNQPLLVQKSV